MSGAGSRRYWRPIAVRCALVALLAVLGSCKKSSSSAIGSRIVIGLRMPFADVKASCPDPFDVNHYRAHYDMVTSTRHHPMTIVGLGPDIELRDCEVRFTLHNDIVYSIDPLCALVPATRSNAEAFIDGVGARLIATGWNALRPDSGLKRTYSRDVHDATVTVQFMNRHTGTDIMGEKAMPGQRWVVDFHAVDHSNGR